MIESKIKKLLKNSTSIVKNNNILYRYIPYEGYEVGIMLKGWEVKSIKRGTMQIIDSYIKIIKNELWLLNSNITPTSNITSEVCIKNCNRKLLMKKSEIKKLLIKVYKMGYTIVPVVMYIKNRNIKLYIVTAKGKKNYDKRYTEKIKSLNFEKEKIRKIRI